MIQKIGSLLSTDAQGYLVPDVEYRKIPTHWQPIVEDIIRFLELNCKETILSCYIRGSVPRGYAIDNVSDLYLILIAADNSENITDSKCFQEGILKKYPFCTGIEWDVKKKEQLLKIRLPQDYPHTAMLLKTQGLHIWGEDVVKDLPLVKPGINTMTHSFNFKRVWKETLDELSSVEDQSELDQIRLWMGKRIIRTAFEISNKAKNSYTRDLYFCYEVVKEETPEMAESFKNVLEVALEEECSKDEMIEAYTVASNWLINKLDKASWNHDKYIKKPSCFSMDSLRK